MSLEASNAALSAQVLELKMSLVLKKDEIRVLKEQQAERLGQIREAIGYSGDIINKAHLFDNEVKTEGHLSAQKILTILVRYGHKMETTLGEMWKLLPTPSAADASSQPSVLVTTPKSSKEATQ